VAKNRFLRRYRLLLLLGWLVTPPVGLLFLLFIQLFSPAEIAVILTTPPLPLFVLFSTVIPLWYLERSLRPFLDHLDGVGERERAVEAVQRFPLRFWLLFLATLLLAPNVVSYSAQHYIEAFSLTATHLFRIHLVALMVSILVGLPIFFRLLDLFGDYLQGLVLRRPQLTVRAKIFLIGALVPLLIDTTLVQYFWSRTGYFTFETFFIWLFLELLAIGGALLFMQSFGRALAPLSGMLQRGGAPNLAALQPRSTDELGLVTAGIRQLLQQLEESRQQAHASQKELKAILDNMQDTYFLTDLDGRLVRVSPSVESLLGHRPEALIGESADCLFPRPGVRERMIERLRAAGGRVQNVEHKLRRRDGTTLWASCNIQYVRGEHGEIAGIEGVTRNIESLKQAEEALFREKERLLVTLESIGDGVITTDIDGVVDYINPVAERLVARPAGDVRGRHYLSILSLRDEATGEPIDDLVRLCLSQEGGLAHADDALLEHEDGTEYTIGITVAPMRDSAQKLIGAVLVLHDITEVMGMARQLGYQASHDMLTGLVNRHEFEQRLEQTLRLARTGQIEGALLYMDLDQFKVVNDTCGHRAGDELLRQLAAILLKSRRESDTLARLGGDEFGIILTNCPGESAETIAEKLLRDIKGFRFVWEGKTFELGASIGLVPLNEQSGRLVDVMSNADAACYVAKEAGRNRIQRYEADDSVVAQHHGEMEWVHRIALSFEEDRFYLVCQPIRPLAVGAVPHHEVLIRLRGQQGETIPPMAFLPAAERYNLMPTIDRWVVRTTLGMLREAQGPAAIPPAHCTINLSGQSLCDDHFLEFVLGQFAEYGIPEHHICFEITETAAIANLTRAMDFITRLKARGCRFALDDFGSGLSSYGYLKNLHVDYLKIDGSFVRHMDEETLDYAIVASINEIGHVMGLQTVAEFVESDATLQILRGLGVDYAQGYAVGRPRPFAEVLAELTPNP